jgi:hypothetical protein
MTYRVIIQPRAERDIWAMAQWIEEQSKSWSKAPRLVRGIRARIETLKPIQSVAGSIPIPTLSAKASRRCSTASSMGNAALCLPSGARRCISWPCGIRPSRATAKRWGRTDALKGNHNRFLSENIVFLGGVQMLIPGQGFRDIYDNFNNRVGDLMAGFMNVVFLY